jgi:hypothetical protein
MAINALKNCRNVSVYLAIMGVLSGCASMVSNVTANLAGSLTGAVLNQNDPETVREGAPAYLLLIDGLIADDPENLDLLLAGARLYSSYAGAFVEDSVRASRLARKGRDYGWRALCRAEAKACGVWESPYGDFERVIADMGPQLVAVLYGAGAAWATWIQTNRDDWKAIGDKARVEAMMRRVVALDADYERGAAYLYLGVLDTLLPEAMGGHPDRGREYFERAVDLSGGRNLMAKVLIADSYARLVFDRALHDRLCREVVAADPEEPHLTLANTLAQELASELLATSEDYFGD